MNDEKGNFSHQLRLKTKKPVGTSVQPIFDSKYTFNFDWRFFLQDILSIIFEFFKLLFGSINSNIKRILSKGDGY